MFTNNLSEAATNSGAKKETPEPTHYLIILYQLSATTVCTAST